MTEDTMEEKSESTKLNDVIGQFEPYQRFVFGVSVIAFFLSGWQGIQVTFLAPPVDHLCVDPFSNHNTSTGQCHDEEYGQCQNWEYSREVFQYTITERLDLVCDSSWLVSLASTLYMIGGSIGNITLGILADRLGRKWAVTALAFPHLLGSLLILYSPNYYVFAVGQFLSGLAVLGLESLTNVLLMEVVGRRYRSKLSTFLSFAFISGQMGVTGSAWLLRNWFYVHLTIVGLSAVFFTSVWFLVESPAWLIVKDKTMAAREAAETINKRNRVDEKDMKARLMILDDIFRSHKPGRKRRYTAFDLFKTPRIRRWTIVLLLYWFVRSGAHYGISLNIHLFGKNLFFNYFLSTVFVYVAIIFCMLGMTHIGRKGTMIWFMMSLGVSCLIYPLANGHPTIRIISVILGKFFAAGSVTVARTYTSEILPTAVRSVGTGLGGLFGRMGSAMAPFTKELGQATHESVPMTVFAILSLVSGGLVFLLPETKGEPLPQSIEEAEGMAPPKKSESVPTLKSFSSLVNMDTMGANYM